MSRVASTAVNVIMWFTGIVAVLIILVWFLQNNPYKQLVLVDQIDEDLLQLSEQISSACMTMEYRSKYNPVTESGFASFSGRDLCIEREGVRGNTLRRCSLLACELNLTKTLDLSTYNYIIISKKGGFGIDGE